MRIKISMIKRRLPHMQNRSIMYLLYVLIGLLALNSAVADLKASRHSPVKISVYSVYSSSPTYMGSSRHGAEKMPIFSGRVSEWVEVVPPITFSADPGGASRSSWVPSSPDVNQWILVLSENNSENMKLQITALPATEANLPNSSLVFGNLMPNSIEGEYNGQSFNLEPFTFELERLSGSRIAVDAHTVDAPYYCKIMIPDMESENRYLLLMAKPHVKGSAMMKYRLVNIPDSLYSIEKNDSLEKLH